MKVSKIKILYLILQNIKKIPKHLLQYQDNQENQERLENVIGAYIKHVLGGGVSPIYYTFIFEIGSI